ncbi:toxin HicA [Dietzia sp. WMMA184]|uniref:toxin HicA n=1 Tax=Dietzia sp. WMMA184 TaxID=2039808 RepID=UPI000BDE7200|nr:toxin HicA [Dietzia sp. WMMA184]
MSKQAKRLERMKSRPQDVPYSDLFEICVEYFGEPRQNKSSHVVFKTPWLGDPRVNIQKGSNGNAKPYQVRQVLKAIAKIQEGG